MTAALVVALKVGGAIAKHAAKTTAMSVMKLSIITAAMRLVNRDDVRRFVMLPLYMY